ncbi:hypothetical protein HDU67_001851 [Dinochytrium kinnereticum]|nr:hypothetical protein HDU67_001851 [Dinochytrium kinnereticum]
MQSLYRQPQYYRDAPHFVWFGHKTMESAIKALKLEIQRAATGKANGSLISALLVADLLLPPLQDASFIQQKIDSEFQRSFDEKWNPARVTARVNRLKSELERLQLDCDDLKTSKEVK